MSICTTPAQFAADDLGGPQRGDGHQLEGLFLLLAQQRAEGAKGNDHQQREDRVEISP